MIKVAVFGANGQLGQTIQYLTKDQNQAFIFFGKEEADITDSYQIDKIFKSNNFKYCINCAAYTNVDGAEKETELAFKINSEGAKKLAESCKANNVILIHLSTDYVFDGANKKPYKTTDITNPLNQYGKSKLKGELNIINTITKFYIIRTSWLYSPFGKNFVKTIIAKIREGEKLKITTEETGTPTSCLDLCDFIFHLIKNEDIPYGIYNFSARGKTTWYNFALEIAKIKFPKETVCIIPVDKYKTQAKRPLFSVLDLKKTEKNFKTLNNWTTSLKRVINQIK